MIDEKCTILSHELIKGDYRMLVLSAPEMAKDTAPGQFVHIRVPGLEDTALRRPFSVFDAGDGKVCVLYKAVGRGTRALTQARAGDIVSVMGPLGHGFPLKCEGDALLVGGGYGVAPLHFLAKRLLATANPPAIKVFIGGRTKDDLLAVEDFAKLGVETMVATNDGSAGATGLVTDPLDDELIRLRTAGRGFELFACGPDPMLKAVAMRATGTGSKGWISMDRHMICGVGACYACIQKTVRGNSRCCIEGPVFAAADLVWS